MKFRAGIMAFALAFLVIGIPTATAVKSTLTLSLAQTPSTTNTVVTLYGTIKPIRSGVVIRLQTNNAGKWKNTNLSTKTTKAGTWKISADATPSPKSIQYRVRTTVGNSVIYSPTRTVIVKPQAEMTSADPALVIEQLGPGDRIHGADISRWQHPNDRAIDFAKMYSAGIRFVMIKASDTRDTADAQALKYLVMDHSAAQAAGIYTGFYYYAILPDVTGDDAIIRDATAQAQKAAWRLASIGGYTEKDLPYALDLEDKCIRLSSSGTCAKYATRSQVTLWAETFLRVLKAKTARAPMLYSYSSFLEGSMNKSIELAQYPLWLAHYAVDPFNVANQPGQKTSGCFVHSWTGANCEPQWTVWQYTSCGIAPKYGVPGSRLDLNIFRGTAAAFLDLAKGSWTPTQVDMMPNNEATTTTVTSQNSTTTNKLVTFNVTVVRPDNSPVVTGTVRLVFDPAIALDPKPIQTALRATSGEWTLAIKGIPAGTYNAKVVFTDQSLTHATSAQSVTFTVEQGPTPTPTPTPAPTKKPSPTPTVAVDSCAKQIKN